MEIYSLQSLDKRFNVMNGVIQLVSTDETSSSTTQSSRSRTSTEESITDALVGFFTSQGDVEEYQSIYEVEVDVAQVALNSNVQVVSKENFKADLKQYCFEGKTFGQKLKNLMVFIFLSIANFFKPDYAVRSLSGRVTK